ncbi:hypothetical protein RHSIM_Rhsim09G0134800 [Rhododendron simsii]|uniref:Pentatricopeptide repeat-containing protein n=1 Tax=Rhododendron simsii TaxID=118357 RepID=A0A834LEQ2_RHOSS|nr:hypothetical protein RHSIM_Rhsim09G0134800 [Rhododendron simsii]
MLQVFPSGVRLLRDSKQYSGSSTEDREGPEGVVAREDREAPEYFSLEDLPESIGDELGFNRTDEAVSRTKSRAVPETRPRSPAAAIKRSTKGLGLFREMIALGTQPNAVTLVSVLPACAGLEFFNLGSLIHGYAVKLGVDSDISLTNTLIALYGKCGIVDTAKCLFDQMPVHSLVSWNSMIATYEQNNAGGNAIQLFHRMEIENIEFDYITMVTVISACANLGALNTRKWVHELVRSRGLETNVSIAML